MLREFIKIESRRLRDLGALIADRVERDPTAVDIDLQTGQILGALSDAARGQLGMR